MLGVANLEESASELVFQGREARTRTTTMADCYSTLCTTVSASFDEECDSILKYLDLTPTPNKTYEEVKKQ